MSSALKQDRGCVVKINTVGRWDWESLQKAVMQGGASEMMVTQGASDSKPAQTDSYR